MKLIMHSCCAPCSLKCVDELRNQGIEPTLFWYNPNIHPFTEYKSRKQALIDWTKEEKINLMIKDEYDIRKFINNIYPNYSDRCSYCYRVRLEEVATEAVKNGFSHFSTTLLISPYQNHTKIVETANMVSCKFGVEFFYYDFRPYFREGQALARQKGIYMQKYCGCIFSEEERYKKR